MLANHIQPIQQQADLLAEKIRKASRFPGCRKAQPPPGTAIRFYGYRSSVTLAVTTTCYRTESREQRAIFDLHAPDAGNPKRGFRYCLKPLQRVYGGMSDSSDFL